MKETDRNTQMRRSGCDESRRVIVVWRGGERVGSGDDKKMESAGSFWGRSEQVRPPRARSMRSCGFKFLNPPDNVKWHSQL